MKGWTFANFMTNLTLKFDAQVCLFMDFVDEFCLDQYCMVLVNSLNKLNT